MLVSQLQKYLRKQNGTCQIFGKPFCFYLFLLSSKVSLLSRHHFLFKLLYVKCVVWSWETAEV